MDDNEFNLEVAKGLLEGLGVEVHTADDGAQAIAMLRERHFDCVLMDIQMPVMDGLEATRRIRADAQIANTLVIAMTANASGADHTRCLQAGMNDVIKKPVEPEKMFLTLATHLHPHRPGPDFAAPTDVAPVTEPVVACVTPKSDALAQWDRLTLQTYVGKQPERQQKLLATFLVSAAEVVRAIPAAIQAGDWKAAAAQGHKLKSSSRCMGAMQLANLCESLEHAGKRGDAEICTGLAAQVQTEFAELQALMEGELPILA